MFSQLWLFFVLLLCEEETQKMKEENQERREEEEEEERTREQEEDRTLKTPLSTRKEDEEVMKVAAKGKAQRKLIGGHTPISTSSSPLLSSLRQGKGGEVDEEEVRVALVTIEDDSCTSESFVNAHLDMTNQITQTEEGGDGKEEEEEGEELEDTEVTSPSLLLQVRLFTVSSLLTV